MPEVSYNYLRMIAERIVTDHNISINDSAIDHFIISSNNRINLLVNYFEKSILYNKPITLDISKQLCSHMNVQLFEPYVQYIHENDLPMAVYQLYYIYDKGISVIDILDAFFAYIKITDLISETNKYEIIELLCKYIHIFYTIHEDEIELALLTNEIIQRIHQPLSK
jgi:DNA polymerase III delta subunit